MKNVSCRIKGNVLFGHVKYKVTQMRWLSASLLALTIGIPLSSAFGAEGPGSFSYEGRIYNEFGEPSSATVKVILRVMDPAGTCVLREEKSDSIDLSASSGFFSVSVGQGTVGGVDPGLNLVQVFANGNAVAGKTENNTACTYSPVAAAGRNLRVIIEENSTQTTLTPDVSIGTAPYAIAADSLQGLTPSAFLQSKNTSSTALTQTNLESLFSPSRIPALQTLADGTSSVYVKKSTDGSAVLPTFSSSSAPSSPLTGSIWFDSTANKIKYYDGSSSQILTTASSGSGSVTTVTGTAPITVENGTTTPVISISDATTSSKGIVQVGSGLATTSGVVNVTYGVVSGTAAQGNDIRLNPAPSTPEANKFVRVNPTGAGYEVRSPAQVKSDLGLALGTDVQAFNARLAELSGLSPTADGFISGNGSGFVLKTPAGARTSLGLGGAALLSIGTSAGTVAAGDDPRLSDSRAPSAHSHIASDITGGMMSVTRGGTGSSSFTADSLVMTNGTGSALQSFAPCSSGQVLGSNGTTWGCVTPSGGSGLPAAGGSATTPGYSFSGDTDTGLFSPALDSIGFSTSGVQRMEVDAAGNVGIGVTPSGEKLEVSGAIRLGNSSATADGTVRWTGTDFEGRKSGAWISMTAGGGGGSVTSVTGTLPISVATGTSTPSISIADATTSTKGAVQVGTGLGVSSGTVSVTYGTVSSTSVQGNDARMNPATVVGDASKMLRVNSGGTAYELRTPAEVLTDLGLGSAALLSVGTTSGTVAAGDDPRLTDARTPTTHVHSAADVTTGILGVARGGTNASSFTADSLIISNGTGSALQSFAPCSPGQVMGSNGTAWGCTTPTGAAGSAAAPGYAFSGDPNTGIFSAAADTIGLATGGISRLMIDPSGTLILGGGDAGTPTATTLRGAAAAGTNIAGTNLTFDASNGTGTGGSGAFIFRTALGGASSSTPNTLNEKVRITNAGNVGIGTSAPTATLDVKGTFRISGSISGGVALTVPGSSSTGTYTLPISVGAAGTVLSSSDGSGAMAWVPLVPSFPLQSSSTGSSTSPVYSFSSDTDVGMFSPGANMLAFSTLGSERLRIDASGNIGIGTTSPSAKLDVMGSVTLGSNSAAEIKLGGNSASPFRQLSTDIISTTTSTSGFGLGSSVSSGSSASGTVTSPPGNLSDLAMGDDVRCTPYSGVGGMSGNLTWSCFKSSSGITINLACGTGTACTLPTDWRLTVIKFN